MLQPFFVSAAPLAHLAVRIVEHAREDLGDLAQLESVEDARPAQHVLQRDEPLLPVRPRRRRHVAQDLTNVLRDNERTENNMYTSTGLRSPAVKVSNRSGLFKATHKRWRF